MVTEVLGYRLQVLRYSAQVLGYRAKVLGYRAKVAGRPVAGARQTGCLCWADRSQVPGRQVAGAGQTGPRCLANRSQVPGIQVIACAGQTGPWCLVDKSQVPGKQVAGAWQTGLRSGTQAKRSRVLALSVQGRAGRCILAVGPHPWETQESLSSGAKTNPSYTPRWVITYQLPCMVVSCRATWPTQKCHL